MQPIKAIVSNGKGRAVNPHSGMSDQSKVAQYKFEESVKTYAAPNIPDGEWECKLRWQYKDESDPDEQTKWHTEIEEDGHTKSVKYKLDTRQIYALYQPVEKELPDIEFNSNCLDPDNYDEQGNFHTCKEVEKEVKMEEENSKTAEDILADMIDMMPYKLPIKSYAYIIEAMQSYASQQTASLRNENERLRKALKNIADSTDGNNPLLRQYFILQQKEALNQAK